jgi:hypothetical protein
MLARSKLKKKMRSNKMPYLSMKLFWIHLDDLLDAPVNIETKEMFLKLLFLF